jgi:hypothetical protein
VNLTLQTPYESVNNPLAVPVTSHINIDSTLRVTVTAGDGGNGATGGAGGALKSISSTSVFDQVVVIAGITSSDISTFPEVNPVVAQLTAGNGGNGTKGAGGAGGSVSALNLVGITHYDIDAADPQAGQTALVITSGNGGNGATTGGAGGAITGVVSQNAQFSSASATTGGSVLSTTELSSATITSGKGGNGGTGNGGAGGLITNLSVGVAGFEQSGALNNLGSGYVSGGELTIQSGGGGTGGTAGKGGAAGAITKSLVGCADDYEQYGLLLQGGVGGSGTLGGGLGGSITNIQLNAPQNGMEGSDAGANVYDVLSTLILAGNGGAATGAGATGGVGGSISQISETKDVNSAINVIQAGNGGASAGAGGAGGSVTNVNTVGLIGQASDDDGHSFGAFQTFTEPGIFNSLFPYGMVPQGVFAGRGGVGKTDGVNGSVISISAAEIAAIGAAVDANGLFAAAAKVANITAENIGYDVNGDHQYTNAGGNDENPGEVVAIDGFIFSETVPTGVNTADNTQLQAFTFVG